MTGGDAIRGLHATQGWRQARKPSTAASFGRNIPPLWLAGYFAPCKAPPHTSRSAMRSFACGWNGEYDPDGQALPGELTLGLFLLLNVVITFRNLVVDNLDFDR
jgi:hypothetical protein